MTREEAIKLAKTEWWDGMTTHDIVAFQLFEEKLCMPFAIFHAAIEDVLGRPVYTHEFAFGGLKKEFLGEKDPPTPEEILDLIPAEKRLAVFTWIA